MRSVIVAILGLGLLGCAPRVAPGQFHCDPSRTGSCPAGWVCLPWANEFRCFDGVGICGNFVLEAGEECDGTDFAGRVCADHYGDSGSMVPHCDDRCRVVCPRCGNGIVDQEIVHIYGLTEDATDYEEGCDHGAMNSDSVPDACRTDCMPAGCGDGVVDSTDTITSCPEDCGVEDIAALGFACALKGDRTVWCWQGCSAGLGDELGTTFSRTPVRVAGLTGVRSMDVGGDHACAILDDHSVWCWGANALGALGDGTTEPRPTPVPAEMTDASDLACGGYFTCAARLDQTVWCWGSNEYGALGDGLLNHPECAPPDACEGVDRSAAPVQVLLPAGAHFVTAGQRHACARLVDGTAWCWGLNHKGQLGDGVTEHEVCGEGQDCSSIPVQVLGLTEVRALALGMHHTCAVTDASSLEVWCWGDNGFGQCGAPTLEFLQANEPHRLEGLDNPVTVAVGDIHSCAADQDGSVWCWGDNTNAQHGTGGMGPASASPVRSNATDVIILAAAWYRTFAVRGDHTAWTWGKYRDEVLPTTQVSELLGACARD